MHKDVHYTFTFVMINSRFCKAKAIALALQNLLLIITKVIVHWINTCIKCHYFQVEIRWVMYSTTISSELHDYMVLPRTHAPQLALTPVLVKMNKKPRKHQLIENVTTA